MSRNQYTHPLEQYVKNSLNVGGLGVTLHRTCRVPEGKVNSLPATLGHFPVYKVSDFHSGCPENFRPEGYFFPMYRQEAMWMGFGQPQTPRALIIAAGNINAISGKPFDRSKDKFASEDERKAAVAGGLEVKLEKKQNYLVVPPQPWLDGWKAEDGKIYQFVAAEMGSGETVEGQITGEETVGGIQFILYEPNAASKDKLVHATRPREFVSGGGYGLIEEGLGIPSAGGCKGLTFRGAGPTLGVGVKSFSGLVVRRVPAVRRVQSMGLGRGGEISQKIYPDPYGPEGSKQWTEYPTDVWNETPKVVEVFYMVSSEDFKQITGHEAPPTPVTYEVYQQYGYPWYDLHDQKYGDAKGSGVFGQLKPVGEGKAPKDLFEKLKPIVKDEP